MMWLNEYQPLIDVRHRPSDEALFLLKVSISPNSAFLA